LVFKTGTAYTTNVREHEGVKATEGKGRGRDQWWSSVGGDGGDGRE